MHSVLFGVMIAIVGLKTRSVIARRVTGKEVRAEVRKLCTWGSGEFHLFSYLVAVMLENDEWNRVH